jgi:hypothetical protein
LTLWNARDASEDENFRADIQQDEPGDVCWPGVDVVVLHGKPWHVSSVLTSWTTLR